MMVLGDVPFGDEEAFKVFLGDHLLCHQGLSAEIERLFGVAPESYPLGDTSGDSDWLLNHYRMHLSLQSIIGLTGLSDLSDVDFDDEQQFTDWMLIHSTEHQNLNLVLNLS
jgi:hypothetical protein